MIARQHYLPAETEQQFAAQLLRALCGGDQMNAMTRCALESAQERFAWGNIAAALQSALGEFARKGIQCR